MPGLIPNERPIEQNNHNPIPRNHEDRTIRINLDEFVGLTHDPEVYIEWESSLDRYFEFKETPPERQYQLAKIKLTKMAAIWLEGLQKQRRREDRGRINTWQKLKKEVCSCKL